MRLQNYSDKLKRYFPFSAEEWKAFIIAVFFLAIIVSWNEWGAARFEAKIGLKNLITSTLSLGIIIYTHHASQRMTALSLGFRAEQKLWWHGMPIALMMALLSDGAIKMIAATSTLATLLPVHRLGAFRYGPNIKTIGKIVLAGPLANIIIASALTPIIGLFAPLIAKKFFLLNITFAWWNLLPIPPLDGSKVFFWTRTGYVLLFSTLTAYLLLIYLVNFYSPLIAFLIGIITWFFFIKMDWV